MTYFRGGFENIYFHNSYYNFFFWLDLIFVNLQMDFF
jgi:hypothetical protein